MENHTDGIMNRAQLSAASLAIKLNKYRLSQNDLVPKAIRDMEIIAGELAVDIMRIQTTSANVARSQIDDRTLECIGNIFDVLENLPPKQTQVAKLVACGYTNREIGSIMEISPQTVKNHIHSIFEKTGVQNRTEFALVSWATEFVPIIDALSRVSDSLSVRSADNIFAYFGGISAQQACGYAQGV